MAEGKEAWGTDLGLTEAQVLSYLKDAFMLRAPSVCGMCWGRPFDEFYFLKGVTLEEDVLRIDFNDGLVLTLWMPRGFSLWRDCTDFGVWGKDLQRGPVVIVISDAQRVRWEETGTVYSPSPWYLEFSQVEGSFQKVETGDPPNFWHNYVVPGEPAFSGYFEKKELV